MIPWLERLSDLFPSRNLPQLAHEEPGGPIVERRFALGTSALLAASFLLGLPRRAGAASRLSFQDVVQRMGELAKPMIQDPDRNEDEYLFHIASLAMTIKEFPPAQFGEPFKTMWGAMSHRGSGIAVIQWRMEPNTMYQAHNHPGYSGMSVGIRGDCRIRNFDYVKPPEFGSKSTFVVRETQDSILRQGFATSIMSTTRDNIHELHAGPDGIHAVDIITKVGADQGFSFLDIASKPLDPQRRTYEAAWGTTQGV